MKKKELFDKTVSVLVKAYMDETLRHCNCYACAVGNLVAANMGYTFHTIKNSHNYISTHDREIDQSLIWDIAHSYGDKTVKTWFDHVVMNRELDSITAKQIKSTGYSAKHLSEIESAFESADDGSAHSMFNGLMSVIDTLMQIHEATIEEAQEAKRLFVKV